MNKNKTILVVDDIYINIILLRKLLSTTPHNVITAGSGAQALDIIKNNHIDLVLLDILMPVMNGFEVLAAIRKNPETKDLPVIIVSALSAHENQDIAISKGANGYLPKPINTADLLKMVNKYCF